MRPPFLVRATPVPTNLAVGRIGSDNVLTWSVSMGGFQDFHVQRKVDAGAWSDMSTPGLSDRTATDTNAAANATYNYRVRTRRAKQYSDWSNETQIVVGGGGATLVAESDLTYEGSFRGPSGLTSPMYYLYHEAGLTFNAANNSIFMAGYREQKAAGEFSIPALKDGTAVAITSLNRGSVIQAVRNIRPPDLGGINNTWYIGGLLVHGDDLIVTIYQYYDGGYVATKSHCVMAGGATDLAGATPTGLFKVNSASSQNTAYYAGAMAPVPAAWQATFGPYITCSFPNLSIESRTSAGPCCSGFDPADLGAVTAVAVDMVHYPYYGGGSSPNDHPLAVPWSTNLLWNQTSRHRGVAFIDDSVLFFGHHGTGTFWYGENGDGQGFTDTCVTSKGPHAYPYLSQIWAYNANDLAEVTGGTRDPWDVSPYAVWNPSYPYQQCKHSIGGVGVDLVNRKLYISAYSTGGQGGESILHCIGVA